MDDDRLADLIGQARARRPDATVFILPRPDGQYSNHATDTVALLEGAGIAVDYATDPMAAGVYALKSADLYLPPLLILFSDAATLTSAIEGVVGLVRWFVGHGPRRTIGLEVTAQKGADGSSRLHIKIDNATVDEAERLLWQGARVKPPR